MTDVASASRSPGSGEPANRPEAHHPGWLRRQRNLLLYSSGAFGFNVFHQTVTLWLVYFYAPPPESGRPTLIPLAAFGLVLAVGRIADAFTDPLIGHWSDSTRSRWGRRLPFIVAATPFLVAAFVFLWSPPAAPMPWAALIAFGLLQVYFLFASLAHQPYEAVLAEIARDPATRIRTSSFKVTFGVLGAALGLVGSGILVESLGFGGMATLLGLIGGATILLSVLGIRHLPRGAPSPHAPSLKDSLLLTLRNSQFRVFVGSEVLFYLGLNMLTALVPYFVTVALGQAESQVAAFTGVFFLVALASLPGVGWLAARRGKRFTYALAMALLVLLLPGLYGVGNFPLVDPVVQGLVYIGLLGAPMSVLFVLPNPMIADIVDAEEARSGLRREGVYFGVEETLNKLGFALSTAIFGVVLGSFGFSQDNPLGIRLIGPIAGFGVLAGLLLFLRGYRLPDPIPSRPQSDPAATGTASPPP